MEVQQTSLKGYRSQNEDKHNVILHKSCRDKTVAPVNLLAVYDGHGGKKVSEYLSNSLPPFFTNKKVAYPLSKDYVNTVYDRLQQVLRYNHKDYSYTSGSTCLVVINFKHKDSEYINVMNTGDSRCVLCRDNVAIALTKDHKPHWPEEKYRISKQGGTDLIKFDGDDWRIKDLSVSRAFGDIEATPYVTHRPDFFKYKLSSQDKFIIIACDGLWDVVTNQEAVNFVLTNSYDISTKKRLKTKANLATQLARYAIAKGSGDNVSIIIAFIN